jgi:hypothetical protein
LKVTGRHPGPAAIATCFTPRCPAAADPFTPIVTDEECLADATQTAKSRALTDWGFDGRVKTRVRATLSYHNDEGVKRCVATSRPVSREVGRGPVNTLEIIDAGRFVWEEEPAKYASTVLDSITGNWP